MSPVVVALTWSERLAIAAFALSVLSFVSSFLWGMYTWRRTGPVLRVKGSIRPPIIQGFGRRTRRNGELVGGMSVIVHNKGRADAHVHDVLILGRKGARNRCSKAPGSPALPGVVPAGGSVTWQIDPASVGLATKRERNPLRLRPLVLWGPGLERRGRVMWVEVPPEYLQGASNPFRATARYWLKTRPYRIRRWLGARE